VIRPTAKAELHSALRCCLVFAGAAEKRKHKTHDAACQRDGSRMVPFAMENSGAEGALAQRLLLMLADAPEELSAAALLPRASDRDNRETPAVCGTAVRPRGHRCPRHAGAAHATSSGHEPAG